MAQGVDQRHSLQPGGHALDGRGKARQQNRGRGEQEGAEERLVLRLRERGDGQPLPPRRERRRCRDKAAPANRATARGRRTPPPARKPSPSPCRDERRHQLAGQDFGSAQWRDHQLIEGSQLAFARDRLAGDHQRDQEAERADQAGNGEPDEGQVRVEPVGHRERGIRHRAGRASIGHLHGDVAEHDLRGIGAPGGPISTIRARGSRSTTSKPFTIRARSRCHIIRGSFGLCALPRTERPRRCPAWP